MDQSHNSNNEEPFEFPITDELDLHTFSPKDVKSVVEEYLIEAHKKGFKIVRIVHGKGIGVLREIVWNVLAKTEIVKSFYFAPEERGGKGATMVEIKLLDTFRLE